MQRHSTPEATACDLSAEESHDWCFKVKAAETPRIRRWRTPSLNVSIIKLAFMVLEGFFLHSKLLSGAVFFVFDS